MSALNLPSIDDLIRMNSETQDGDGSVSNRDPLEDLVSGDHVAIQYGVNDEMDPLQMGAAYAYVIVNFSPFVDGNKSTGTKAVRFIAEHNGMHVAPGHDDDIKDAVNDMYDRDFDSIVATAEVLRGFVF